MKLAWDREHGLAYLYLTASGTSRVARSVPVEGGLVLDYNLDGHLVGIEFLHAETLLPTFLVHLAERGEIVLP
jgi:uncharacterized protein YuzE